MAVHRKHKKAPAKKAAEKPPAGRIPPKPPAAKSLGAVGNLKAALEWLAGDKSPLAQVAVAKINSALQVLGS